MTPAVLISERQADYLDTELSTEQTVKEMCGHIHRSLEDPEVGRVAMVASNTAASFQTRAEIAARVWAWCKRNIRFVTDEELLRRLLNAGDELELLISPSVLLRARRPEGDCDDFAMLACALLQCLGVRPLIKTFKCDRQEPWRWSHVCAAAVLEDGSIFPVDASHGDYPGWEVPASDVYESQLWDMNGNRVGGLGMGRVRRGLGAYQCESGWTGSPMDSTADSGAYPINQDIRGYYREIARARGLQGIARGKYGRGLGQEETDPTTATGFDLNALVDPGGTGTGTPAGDTSAVAVTSAPVDFTDLFSGLFSSSPSSSSTGGAASFSSDFSSLLSQLTGSASSLVSQALATPGAQLLANGTVLMPNGQIVGTPTSSSAISGTTLLYIGGALAVFFFAMSLGKK